MQKPDFKIHQKLHRQRRGRRKSVTILNQAEIANLFAIPESQVKEALDAAGWRYHEDANGAIWASVEGNPQPDG